MMLRISELNMLKAFHSGDADSLVYTDETNFNLWTCRSYGRSKIGTKCNYKTSNGKGQQISLICSICPAIEHCHV